MSLDSAAFCVYELKAFPLKGGKKHISRELASGGSPIVAMTSRNCCPADS